jgi:hypothetical protein
MEMKTIMRKFVVGVAAESEGTIKKRMIASIMNA